MNVLGIETSCDETAAAVINDSSQVVASIVLSQVGLHRPYGGVVPEVASRAHLEYLPDTVRRALDDCGLSWSDLDTVAVTYGPGLASSLLVGLAMAKGLAFSLGKPLTAVNHLKAHIFSAFLGGGRDAFERACPFVALVVSGGHTCLVRVEGWGRYRLLGQTIDDAAGEAFDKGANLLGLGYPGGPAIELAARDGDPARIVFPRGRQRPGKSRFFKLDVNLCFSFSGLKTALLYHLRDNPVAPGSVELSDVAAGYQEAIVDALVERCASALGSERKLVVAGGVSLNKRLREKVGTMCDGRGVELLLPEPRYCADNAAMIAGLAAAGGGVSGEEAMALDAEPSLRIASAWSG